MPRLFINTNIKDADLPDDFEEQVAKKISEVLDVPLEVVYISVSSGNRMINNGKTTPMIFMDIESMNRISPEKNPGYSKVFIPYFSSLLHLPENSQGAVYPLKERKVSIKDKKGYGEQDPDTKFKKFEIVIKYLRPTAPEYGVIRKPPDFKEGEYFVDL